MHHLDTHREADGTSFDWFKTYADVAPLLRDVIPDKSARILMLGCGNSTLSQDVCVPFASFVLLLLTSAKMWDDDYKNIVNVDVSPLKSEQQF